MMGYGPLSLPLSTLLFLLPFPHITLNIVALSFPDMLWTIALMSYIFLDAFSMLFFLFFFFFSMRLAQFLRLHFSFILFLSSPTFFSHLHLLFF
jgi:hypothetical protein